MYVIGSGQRRGVRDCRGGGGVGAAGLEDDDRLDARRRVHIVEPTAQQRDQFAVQRVHARADFGHVGATLAGQDLAHGALLGAARRSCPA